MPSDSARFRLGIRPAVSPRLLLTARPAFYFKNPPRRASLVRFAEHLRPMVAVQCSIACDATPWQKHSAGKRPAKDMRTSMIKCFVAPPRRLIFEVRRLQGIRTLAENANIKATVRLSS